MNNNRKDIEKMKELDYKKEIIKLLEEIDGENVLAYLYFFIKNKIKAEDVK